MKKILEGPSQRVGTIFQTVDTNFIEVCNSILRIAFPKLTLKDYADKEPTDPVEFDAYLIRETATVWTIACEKDDILFWNNVAWVLLPYKITEINAAKNASDTHTLRGAFNYHEQVPGQDTAGDWRQFADASGFYTQRCETGNVVQGAGTWITKQTIPV